MGRGPKISVELLFQLGILGCATLGFGAVGGVMSYFAITTSEPTSFSCDADLP